MRENNGRNNTQRDRAVLQLSLLCLFFPAVPLEEGYDLATGEVVKSELYFAEMFLNSFLIFFFFFIDPSLQFSMMF